MRLPAFILAILFAYNSRAQVLGGNSVFNFLRVPNTPQLSALGGINISQPSDDAGLAFNNPALLVPSMHGQINAVFNDFYAGASIYHLSGAYTKVSWKTNFLAGVHYFNYGNVAETDASGNILGRFHPIDYVIQFAASRKYLEKWNYGAAIKFIHSGYGQYRSSGIAMDVGINFRDTVQLFSFSFLFKNMGAQIKRYEGSSTDQLPFDLQAGITKRLKGSPFSFSLTAQKMHQFNIRYDDTTFNADNGYANSSDKKFTLGKLFDHLVLASTIYAGDKVEAYLGYNFLRRRELNMGNSGNGLNGFSLGVGVMLGKFQLRYGRAWYQSNTAYNQLGMNVKLLAVGY